MISHFLPICCNHLNNSLQRCLVVAQLPPVSEEAIIAGTDSHPNNTQPQFRKKFLCEGNIVLYELTSYHPKTESEFLSENFVCAKVTRVSGENLGTSKRVLTITFPHHIIIVTLGTTPRSVR
jgi:hypothetical protein